MNSISGLMRDYFAGDASPQMLGEAMQRDLPIKPYQTKWRQTQDGSALIRTYEFKTIGHIREFVDGLLSMQEQVGHPAQILIENKTVKVRVGTLVLNRVTELDTEYAAQSDNIYDELSNEGR